MNSDLYEYCKGDEYMKCLICKTENENRICDRCLNNGNIQNIINNSVSDDYFYDSDNISFIASYLDSPLKEYYLILSKVYKHYSVSKTDREFLINNSYKCLESNIFTNDEKNIINSLLLDAYYKNYQFELAEKIANELIEGEINELSLYVLGNYYICTRRYDDAFRVLFKALKLSEEEKTIESINNKIKDCEARRLGNENGGKAPYLPATEENRKIYIEFMSSIGFEVELPKVRAKAPGKIPVDEYPRPVELIEAGFKTFVAFDIESTGFDHSKDSITELAAIRVVDGKIVETKEFIFQELVHPYKKRIPKNVEELTGITNEMVKESRDIWEVFADFVEFIKDDILVGYNCMTFDSKFLVRAGRLSNIVINNKYFDVMNYVKKFKYVLNYDKKDLNSISGLLGITNPNAHRALADSITTAKVYLKLLELDNKE